MRRREFIAIVAGAASWPLATRAQQGERMRRIGVLVAAAENDPDKKFHIGAFQERLKQLGWIEGRNIRLDYRWIAGEFDRARIYARELVTLAPDAILATNAPTLEALRQETRTIPLVFMQIPDPVGGGYVPSLAHPGGHITGFTHFEYAIGGKWLELLKELAPRVTKVAVIWNPKNISVNGFFPKIEVAAPLLGAEAIATHVQSAADIERSINAFARQRNVGLIVPSDFTTVVNREPVIALAAQYGLPAIYPFRLFVRSGGLISYGIDLAEVYRQAASYINRILKSEKPGDLPVQAPTKFELVINLKTAKALGLTVPPTLLVAADELIE